MQMRDRPSVTSRRPLTRWSVAEASGFRHHDALTIDHSIDKFCYRRARAVTIGKGLKPPQLLIGRKKRADYFEHGCLAMQQ
jgi:hypothetical protein